MNLLTTKTGGDAHLVVIDAHEKRYARYNGKSRDLCVVSDRLPSAAEVEAFRVGPAMLPATFEE